MQHGFVVDDLGGLSPPISLAPEALRYDVEAGSPLYAEVFRRLVQNEGLMAVLDLVPSAWAILWWKITMIHYGLDGW